MTTTAGPEVLAGEPGAAVPPTPVAEAETVAGAAPRDQSLAVRIVLRAGRAAGATLAATAIAVVLWQGCLWVLHLNPYFAKGPGAVFDYLFVGPEAAANRDLVFSNLGTTLFDALFGYVAGTIAAIVLALAVVVRRSVESTVMPVAIALRAVPIVAMTPLLVLVFGRGLLAVTVIAGIVSFFPSLVNVVFGLRSAPSNAFDLMRAYGASDRTIVTKVQFPYCLPSLFAAAKIAAPGAIVGATLAEWLATGNGLGNLMNVSSSDSQWSTLWSSVVVITLASVLIYNLVAAVERPVLARYRPGA